MIKSLATPLVFVFVQWQNLIFIYIQIVCQNFCVSMACTKIPMAYLETSPHAQDPAKCISLFYASHVLKYCTVHNMQAQREYHIIITFNESYPQLACTSMSQRFN